MVLSEFLEILLLCIVGMGGGVFWRVGARSFVVRSAARNELEGILLLWCVVCVLCLVVWMCFFLLIFVVFLVWFFVCLCEVAIFFFKSGWTRLNIFVIILLCLDGKRFFWCNFLRLWLRILILFLLSIWEVLGKFIVIVVKVVLWFFWTRLIRSFFVILLRVLCGGGVS